MRLMETLQKKTKQKNPGFIFSLPLRLSTFSSRLVLVVVVVVVVCVVVDSLPFYSTIKTVPTDEIVGEVGC